MPRAKRSSTTSSSFIPRRQRHRRRRPSASSVGGPGTSPLRVSALPLDEHFLDLCNRTSRIEVLRAHISAVHDGVAAIKPERVLELIEPLTGGLVAAVDNPTVSREQCRRAKEAVA